METALTLRIPEIPESRDGLSGKRFAERLFCVCSDVLESLVDDVLNAPLGYLLLLESLISVDELLQSLGGRGHDLNASGLDDFDFCLVCADAVKPLLDALLFEDVLDDVLILNGQLLKVGSC